MGICKGVDLQALTSDTISLGFLNSCDSLYWDVPRKLYSDDEGPYAIGICSSFLYNRVLGTRVASGTTIRITVRVAIRTMIRVSFRTSSYKGYYKDYDEGYRVV